MKIYYANSSGKLLAANYDRDDFKWKNTINIPYSVYELDELDNALCFEMAHAPYKFNDAGESKYYINNGILMERETWVERDNGGTP